MYKIFITTCAFSVMCLCLEICSMTVVPTFSVMLSSLQNWANHNKCRLWPNIPAQLCWSSSRPQPQ